MPLTSYDLHTPFETHGPTHIQALLERLRLTDWMNRFPPRLVWSLYVLFNGFITIVLLSLVAILTNNPFVFPSLGPTAYLFFFAPLSRASSPRHALLGHGLAILCGYLSLLVTGMELPPGIAAALSLGFTGALMVLFRISHPPAGATTLIISLRLIVRPLDLVIVET